MEMISDFDRPPGTVKTAGYRVNEALEAKNLVPGARTTSA